MRDLGRLVAALLAGAVILRDIALAGPGTELPLATALTVAAVFGAVSLWRDGLITGGGVALLAHYGLALYYGHVAVDFGAPVVAAAVLVFLETCDVAETIPRGTAVDSRFVTTRLQRAGTITLTAALAGGLCFAVASLPWPSATLTRAIGVVGAAVAFAVPGAIWVRQRQ